MKRLECVHPEYGSIGFDLYGELYGETLPNGDNVVVFQQVPVFWENSRMNSDYGCSRFPFSLVKVD